MVDVRDVAAMMIEMAEKLGARLVGVAVVDNPFFRKNQYREVGFVRGKIMLIKKSVLTFNPALRSKEDYDFTAQNLYALGKVLIDNSVYPVAKSYAQGGCGPKSTRATYDREATAYLLKQWPNLFRIKEKESSAPESEVQLRFTNLEQVQEWRNQLASAPLAQK